MSSPLQNAQLNCRIQSVISTKKYESESDAIKDWNSKQTTFVYDNNANQTSQVSPSTTNVTDTFGYDASDAMTSVSDSNGSTLFSATYTRDNNGQLASDSSQASNQRNYKYTGMNQLCYAGSGTSNACTSPPANSYPYAFDNADNLTTNNGYAQQYNNADQLCWRVSGASGNNCATTPTGATTYGYDNKGNRTYSLTSGNAGTCDAYSQANRLTSIKTGTGSTCTSPTTVGTYAYDGDSIRESKVVSGTTTYFTWDGVGGDLLQQYDGATKTSFIYGPRGIPVEQIAGSTTAYLHHDQIGSTRLITDSAGATGTATTLTYDPYGNLATSSGSLTSPLQYTGQYLDAESGLYQLRARYYDPATSQFLSSDPAIASTLSPHAYVAGNPLDATDPSGLSSTIQPPIGPCCITTTPSGLGDVVNIHVVPEELLGDRTLVHEIPTDLLGAGPACGGFVPVEDSTLILHSDAGAAGSNGLSFPDNPGEMEGVLGVPGTPVPDRPDTPGRDKVQWDLGPIRITFEQHPYHPGAPASHAGPHWHVDWPGSKHNTFVPGDKVP